MSYIDYSLGGVFDVDADREVEEVVHRVACVTESVDGLLPGEGSLVPSSAVEYRPTAQTPQHVQKWLYTALFNRRCQFQQTCFIVYSNNLILAFCIIEMIGSQFICHYTN